MQADLLTRVSLRRLATRDGVEVIEAVLLSITTVVTAWSAFQASVWDGNQISRYAQADEVRAESIKATNLATVQLSADTTEFDRWMAARADGNSALETAVEASMRPALRDALEAWIADGGADGKPNAPASPLQEKAFLQQEDSAADGLMTQAEALTTQADDANRTSDYYILVTVLFALVLFMVGIGSKLRSEQVRLGLASFATFCLLCGVVVVVLLPTAWP